MPVTHMDTELWVSENMQTEDRETSDVAFLNSASMLRQDIWHELHVHSIEYHFF